MKKNWSELLFVFLFLFWSQLVFGFVENETGMPLRLSFPHLCESDFDNNIVTKLTWIESEDAAVVAKFRPYLKLIPKSYHSNCIPCLYCKGIELIADSFISPVDRFSDFVRVSRKDIGPYWEIHKCHVNNSGTLNTSCEMLLCEMGRINGGKCIGSQPCNVKAWDGGYFRKWNHKYLYFFEHYLTYCSQNSSCSCYWPELSYQAMRINDEVYDCLKFLTDEGRIDHTYSEFWKGYKIKFDYWKGRYFSDELYYPNSHGMAASLATYTFFYSQYHQLLLDISSFIDNLGYEECSFDLDWIYHTLSTIRGNFLSLYSECLEMHPHPKIFYERGMLYMHVGNTAEALSDIRSMIELATTPPFNSEDLLTSEMYQQEGEAYADLGMYDKAIEALTKAIQKDPNNKEAFFCRAANYFEIGDFDSALNDYLNSNKSQDLLNQNVKVGNEFSEALLKGLTRGGTEAVTDFFPSMCYSAYGASQSLWAFAKSPISTSKNFYNACYSIGAFTADYFKFFDWTQVDDCAEGIKDFCYQFDQLSDAEKGDKIGYFIGRYGVDFFVPGTVMKGIAALKKLKNANRMCNLEALVASQASKEAVAASAMKHAANREAYFKNAKIHWDKQNKHVPGKHNYESRRSTFQHPDSEGLLKKFGGKGRPMNKEFPGSHGYKEIVDFGEHIGIYKNENNTIVLPTTKGIIHYSKKGAHIVPAHPNTPVY